ncbi:hypothetical protein BMS3Abin16_01156 [archaeon BMS3Abin16]|nr:hypothetical protein BMS3Abin16_01156 [archaeon BMS3Abin16]
MNGITSFINRAAAELLFLNNWIFVFVLLVIVAAVYFYTRDWRR